MRDKLVVLALIAFSSPALAHAQKWLGQLPQKAPKDMTFYDYREAFQRYFNAESLTPELALEGRHLNERFNIEQYKLFMRWAWFTEPRVYPSGRWDFEKIDAVRRRLAVDDNRLLMKEMSLNLLNLTYKRGKIEWPANTWKPLGPSDAIGGTNLGRVTSIQFSPMDSRIIYVSTADGGVWKSSDSGRSWAPIFDSQPTLSVGDVVIDPHKSQIIYVATSDPFGYGTPFWGGTYSIGVSKSTDGGNTWTATGLPWSVSQERTIRRLAISPTEGNILLAATSDGLYRTSNAGSTWTRVLDESAFDVKFERSDGRIVYVTTDRVYKSRDAGATFFPLSATCSGTRYTIEIARTNPEVLYTLCTDGVVQKSTNAGATWTTVTAPRVILFGYYDNVLAVSPRDDKDVYVAGFDMRRSTDGGTTWTTVRPAGHVDNHYIKFLPGSGSTLLVGNDGGLFKSVNSGASWSPLNKGLEITQFYSIGSSRAKPSIMELGAQDNGNMKYDAGAFENIGDGDGMQGFIDWSNVNNIYISFEFGDFRRSTNGGASFTAIPTPAKGQGKASWISPWCQDPVVPNTIYAGTDRVYKSTNQGTTWTPISNPFPGIATLSVLKVAPSNVDFIYAAGGTKLYRTQDGGASWTEITAGLPVETNYLTDIAVNDKDPRVLYVTFSGYTAGQKVYKSADGGSTWINITGSLPNMPANAIVHENKADNPLYVGTDAGVYYLNDRLKDWVPYKSELPNVIVNHLEIDYATGIIRAATYGRGVWEAGLN